ncbi:hypothetical protein CURE108131_17035 [Cupriavidus respiraculi]|uniref:Uncharacterized protein n=1 Tax=Cupriavidus respiraculi TaxID=195930 RepID=A0ABM8X316_9BURK|nr:hypothetical protein LMG21510_02512 [Cupriavidus respiraculi]
MTTNRHRGGQIAARTSCPLSTVRLARRRDGIAVTLGARAATGTRASLRAATASTTAWHRRCRRPAAAAAVPCHPPRRGSVPRPCRPA